MSVQITSRNQPNQTLRTIDIVAVILLIIGGLNWGLVAINPNYDIVAAIGGGQASGFAKFVYGLVGLAAIYAAVEFPSFRTRWTGRRLQPT